MSPTKLCEWGDHGLCSGLSVVGPCPCECHQESGDLNRVKFDPPLTDAEADAFWAAISDESESEGRES